MSESDSHSTSRPVESIPIKVNVIGTMQLILEHINDVAPISNTDDVEHTRYFAATETRVTRQDLDLVDDERNVVGQMTTLRIAGTPDLLLTVKKSKVDETIPPIVRLSVGVFGERQWAEGPTKGHLKLARSVLAQVIERRVQ